ncbi:class I SAM-dependent methyltransferase [Thermodesulfobacteriota bacterium]
MLDSIVESAAGVNQDYGAAANNLYGRIIKKQSFLQEHLVSGAAGVFVLALVILPPVWFNSVMTAEHKNSLSEQFLRLEKTFNTFAELEPFFTVLTADKYLVKNMDDARIQEFFQSGHSFVGQVLWPILARYGCRFEGGRCLDFGCGLGRITFALAPHFGRVVGGDISEEILKWARDVLAQLKLQNVSFVKTGEEIRKDVAGSFDFVHSVLVFQHMTPPLMQRSLGELLDILAQDGVAALHVPVSIRGYAWDERKADWAVTYESIQMHCLPRKEVERIAGTCGCVVEDFAATDLCGEGVENGYFIIRKLRC